jgi:hypothetical protein
MRARLTALVLALVIGFGLITPGAATASSGSAASTVRIRVVGIDRSGQRVSVAAEVFSTNALPVYVAQGRTVLVPVGVHWIGAEVDTPDPSHDTFNATLVMRRVKITRSRTVLLDARPGRLVRFTLDARGATDRYDQAQACLGGNFVAGGFEVIASPGNLYAVPQRSAIMTFGVGSSWQGPGEGYLIAAHRSGGIPDGLTFRASLSGMASMTIEMRAGTTAGGYDDPNLAPSGRCAVGFSFGFNSFAGTDLAQHVTAGRWTASVLGPRGDWLGSTRHLVAGHSYTDVFGAAVWGPNFTESPQENGGDGGRIMIPAGSPFTDPNHPNGNECCDKSRITLKLGGHVIGHKVVTGGLDEMFVVRTSRSGWYTLAIKAWRSTPGQVIPNDLLSRKETVTWRFFAAPRSVPAGDQRGLPVRVARIVALGLNIDNQAPPSGSTPLRVQFVEPYGPGRSRVPPPRLTSARLLASFDGGKTWQAVPLTRHRLFWLATVHDPASGFVALRSIVIDSRGDRSEQTIYQAYAIG